MLLLTIVIQLFSSQVFAEDSYSLLRLEPRNNRAVIATIHAQNFSVGQEFSVETPQGLCQLLIKKIVTDYIYVDTEQCQAEYLSAGTPVFPRKPIVIERVVQMTVPVVDASVSGDSVSADVNILNGEFYESFIKNKLSATASYLTGNSLDGQAQINSNTTIEDFRGSNTISFGADYIFAQLPYNLSFSGGLAYSLPRSYGRFTQSFNDSSPSAEVPYTGTAKLQTFNFYANLRYQWDEKTWAYFGLNRLFADSSGLPGSFSGDFGFHFGGRRYVYETMFAEASLNFYNLDYTFQGQTTDFSQTELELKAGYTF